MSLRRPKRTLGPPGRRLSTGAATLALAAPVAVLFGMFFCWPLLDILLRSLNPQGSVSYNPARLHFGNYLAIARIGVLRTIFAQTFKLAAISTAITTLLAFPTAYLMSRLSARLSAVLLLLIFIPFWVSILVRLFAFTEILGQQGVVNTVIGHLGLGGPYSLLFNTQATVIGMVAYLLPYMILLLYARMLGIDTSLLSAAKTLGASGRQTFRLVYLPLVRQSVIGGMLLIFVLSLGFFLTPAILGGPQDTTIPVFIQQQVSLFEWGTASATGIVLLLVSTVGYVIAIRAGASAVLPGSTRAGGRGSVEREPLRLSASSVLLWIPTGIVLLLLLLPIAIVIPTSFDASALLQFPPHGLTTHWYSDALHDPTWRSATIKSIEVALGTALVATLVGLVLARLLGKITGRSALAGLQALIYAPIIVPVILLAIGIYDIETKLGLIETTIGLVLAHTIIAFPFAFAVLSNALAGLDPSLEEAAWTLGASRSATFWTVVVPSILPSLFGAALISFMTSWDEPVIALFQTGLQKTLPVTIFSLLRSGVTPTVPAVATLLIGVVLLGAATAVVVRGRQARASERRRVAGDTPAYVVEELSPNRS